MSTFDLTNMSMQGTEPETDCIVPRINLRDEVFAFIDGKWVNEIYLQQPSASHWKFPGKSAQSEWSILEENRALWEENHVLWIENRMLWEENKALQRLRSENEAAQVLYTDAIQQSLKRENKLFPFFQEGRVDFQVNPGNRALQVVREKNRALEDFQQGNKAIPITWKGQTPITVHEESKAVSSHLSMDTDAITAVEEVSPGSASEYGHEAPKSIAPTQDKTESAPRMQGEHENLWALQNLYKSLHIFLKVNNLLGEKQGYHVLYDVNRSFKEDYNKLKLQLNAVRNTVSEITDQMEMLEREIIDITSLMYEEAEEQVVTEHQLGEM
ncbi:SPERT protein, partial [Rhinopomastus cyanomelas]|nr:SPERT protein [Rhinopomastus cyanomelas]